MKRYLFLSIYIITIILLFKCDTKNENDPKIVVSMNQATRPLRELKDEIFLTGDIDSYNELSIAYLDYPDEDFLFWALIMANKHDYSVAYLDVYYVLCWSYECMDNNLEEMDKKTQDLALEYLRISAEKGDSVAREIITNHFPKLQ